MKKKISGIYKIMCLVNNKIYIGSAIDIKSRWREHANRLKRNKHENKYLQNAFNKYGIEKFEFSIIEYVEDVNLLLEREQYWIDSLDVCNKKIGFNILPIAGSRIGYHCKQETKDKISKSLKGRKRPDLAGKNNPMYGRCGDLHPNYKKKLSEEQKKQISKTLTGKYIGNKNPNYNNGKNIICIDNELIFDNSERAGEYFHIPASSILNVCHKKQYTTHGLRFCFLEDYDENLKKEPIIKKTNAKSIRCVETNKIFKSLKECAEEMKLSVRGISSVLNGRQKHTGGYRFEYYKD